MAVDAPNPVTVNGMIYDKLAYSLVLDVMQDAEGRVDPSFVVNTRPARIVGQASDGDNVYEILQDPAYWKVLTGASLREFAMTHPSAAAAILGSWSGLDAAVQEIAANL